jgi:hypothetical protein
LAHSDLPAHNDREFNTWASWNEGM